MTQYLKPGFKACRLANSAAEGPSWHSASRGGLEGEWRRVSAGVAVLIKLTLRVVHREGTWVMSSSVTNLDRNISWFPQNQSP